MSETLLPTPPADSELARWIEDGQYREPADSDIVAVEAPEEAYGLRIHLDDPVIGYLIDLYDDGTRLARTVVTDQETAISVATEMVAAAPELRELESRCQSGPLQISEENLSQGPPPVPEEWADAEDEWETVVQEAIEEADIPQSKGTLVTKRIDGRDYYYLQWRDGDTVTSKYVAPVTPS